MNADWNGLQSEGSDLPGARVLKISLVVLALLIVGMVMLGGYVRLSGSGLSIPHWPLIDGKLLPPGAEDTASWTKLQGIYHAEVDLVESERGSAPVGKTETLGEFKKLFWVEYSHRALATFVGWAWLASLVCAVRKPVLRRLFGVRVAVMGVLIVLQAIIGGWVVLKQLQPEKVALHLGLAFFLFCMVQWTIMELRRPPLGEGSRKLHGFVLGAWIVTFLQILVGGLMAGSFAGYTMNTWPKMGDYWIPPGMWTDQYAPAIRNLFENPTTVQFIHRYLAWFVALKILLVGLKSRKFIMGGCGRCYVRASVVLVVLQFLVGIMTLVMKVHMHTALTHQLLGLLLLGALTGVLYEARHGTITPRGAAVPAEDSKEVVHA